MVMAPDRMRMRPWPRITRRKIPTTGDPHRGMAPSAASEMAASEMATAEVPAAEVTATKVTATKVTTTKVTTEVTTTAMAEGESTGRSKGRTERSSTDDDGSKHIAKRLTRHGTVPL